MKSGETTVVTSNVPSLRYVGVHKWDDAVILGLRRLSMSREINVTDILETDQKEYGTVLPVLTNL